MNVIAEPNQFYFDCHPVKDFADLVSRYGGKEFKSPMRSTVPLLSLVRDGWPLIQELLTSCHLPVEFNLHFEYRVDSPLGVGIPSHTDVMVRSGDAQLALECKWTEPRYETVNTWMLKPPDPDKHGELMDPDNRRKRLAGWLRLLQPHASCDLDIEAFSETVYQMVHRAASACMETQRPQLAYVLFTPLPGGKSVHTKQYESDLKHLHQALGHPPGFPFHLIEVQIATTKAFHLIQNLPKASSQTAKTVQDALRKGGLFKFNKVDITTI